MTQDMAERITARVDYDGEWDGQWCETGREPIGIHAYHHAEYARLDLLTAAEAERDAEKARADALAENLAMAVETLKFYGNKNHYSGEYISDQCGCCGSWYEPKIHKDGEDSGDLARATLAAIQETDI